MAVTIYDIAREASVGIGTVSRCLNNHPSVSAKTRASVLAVAKRLDYYPHTYARRLASRQTNTFSAIIPYFTNYFFVEVLQGIQEKASELGWTLFCTVSTSPHRRMSTCGLVAARTRGRRAFLLDAYARELCRPVQADEAAACHG
jgi:DNA-binding LacI/PurR family transcriptional regulator